MTVLGHPSLEESYPSLANWSGSGPSRVKKRGQRWCPCQEDKLSLLSGLWSQGLSLSLSPGGLQFLKPGRAVPNIPPMRKSWRNRQSSPEEREWRKYQGRERKRSHGWKPLGALLQLDCTSGALHIKYYRKGFNLYIGRCQSLSHRFSLCGGIQ